MKIIKRICAKNPCYRQGRKITVRGLMLHSVGCPQENALAFINIWDNADYGSACAHGIVGGDGKAYQTLPWDHRGWHCGRGAKGSGNDTHIGIEMCEPDCIRYTGGAGFVCSDARRAKKVVKKTYKSAVALFARLCEKYGLDPLEDGVILSHREGCARGIATNHVDPEHLWRGLGLPYTMDAFRAAVAKKMGVSAKPAGPIQTAAGYKVRVAVKKLNVRKGPGVEYALSGAVEKGEVYTIVGEERRGGESWGKLKSGAGYVCLKHTERI